MKLEKPTTLIVTRYLLCLEGLETDEMLFVDPVPYVNDM